MEGIINQFRKKGGIGQVMQTCSRETLSLPSTSSYHANQSTLGMDTDCHIQATVTVTTQIEEAHSTTNQAVDGEGDKRAIYRHPLFPLMALLLEKCEQATQTPDCPSSDSFDVDIQAFVLRQEQDQRPFFVDDMELDGLMVKAIQVLRIHLLELEKVNELCKDFCSRYITCLKGKLQSENLLRTEMSGFDGDLSGEESLLSPGGTHNNNTVGVHNSNVNLVIQGNLGQSTSGAMGMTSLGQGQVVSGGTVYQMVHTPQGLVAQPIQIQQPASLSSCVSTSPSVIQGTTPMSQIGLPVTPEATLQHSPTTPSLLKDFNFADEDEYGKRKNKRGILPKQATQVMKSWLFQHIVHPYPTEEEKRQIAAQTNLTLLQVNNWFINARRRILQPMLDASNPEGTKAKKSKPTQNRPVQRFWPENLANLQSHAQSTTAMSVDGAPSPGSIQSPTSTSSPLHIEVMMDEEEEEEEEEEGEDFILRETDYHMNAQLRSSIADHESGVVVRVYGDKDCADERIQSYTYSTPSSAATLNSTAESAINTKYTPFLSQQVFPSIMTSVNNEMSCLGNSAASATDTNNLGE